MDRAYSILSVKSMTEEDGFFRIKGIASTPSVDRSGDIVDPMGAKFKTPMPLLWQHSHEAPVGNVVFASPTAKGIPFEAALPIIKEEGSLKTRVDEAIQSVKYGLVSAVSIGFSAMDSGFERLKSGGRKYNEWEWLELSLVTIPANADAVITAIKSMDSDALASAGIKQIEAIPAADLSGQTKRGPVRLTKSDRKPQSLKILVRNENDH